MIISCLYFIAKRKFTKLCMEHKWLRSDKIAKKSYHFKNTFESLPTTQLWIASEFWLGCFSPLHMIQCFWIKCHVVLIFCQHWFYKYNQSMVSTNNQILLADFILKKISQHEVMLHDLKLQTEFHVNPFFVIDWFSISLDQNNNGNTSPKFWIWNLFNHKGFIHSLWSQE